MYKLLVVDDEQVERSGLRMMVGRLLPNVEIVGEAANGREAIEFVERYRPDIVTMDIKMPGIDGLQATREILKKYPAVKIIIFSAYDTFAYAQEAMQLGIKDYVLKPYTKEEVVKVINRIVHIIEEERSEQAEKLAITERYQTILPLAETELLTTVIFNHVHDVSKKELSHLLDIDDTGGYMMLLRLWREDNVPFQAREQEDVYLAVKKALKQLTTCLVGPMVGQQIPVAVFDDEKKTDQTQLSHRSRATQLFTNFTRRLASQAFSPSLCCAAGIGRPVESLKSLRHSYQESLFALRHVERPQQLQFYDDIEHSGSATARWLLHQEKQLLEAVRRGDAETCQSLFDEFFAGVVAVTEYNVDETARYVTQLFVVLLRISDDAGAHDQAYTRFDTFPTLDDIREAASFRLQQVVHMMEYRLEQQQQSIFAKAKRYLEEHFHENVSLETVAGHVGLSSYYFSKLFKERAGVTFIDYLTQLRVEEAKRLLVESGYSLKEICFEVGYRDPNYFSRVFKKTAGMTPSAFRRKQDKKV